MIVYKLNQFICNYICMTFIHQTKLQDSTSALQESGSRIDSSCCSFLFRKIGVPPLPLRLLECVNVRLFLTLAYVQILLQ